jgi:hypothetical protein
MVELDLLPKETQGGQPETEEDVQQMLNIVISSLNQNNNSCKLI